MPRTGTTTAADITINAREVDFVTRFGLNWEDLRTILGISRPVKKALGTKLTSYTVSSKGGLAQAPAEGAETSLTEFEIKPATYSDITVERYEKAVTVDAIAQYGGEIAVEKTDDQFLVELQDNVMGRFYTFINTGSLKGTQKTWQRALAIAKGAVLNKFKKMHKNVTEVVGFANIMDFYDWLGDQQITVQTLNGIQYIKGFMGYETLILLSEDEIPAKTVIATPVENLVLYYIDPSDSDFAKAGIDYTTEGETNLIGVHIAADYKRGTTNTFALLGMALWAEYLDGIAVVTVGSSNTTPAVAAPSTPSQQ